jgi:hypothetical protein
MSAIGCEVIKSVMVNFITSDSIDFKKRIGKKNWNEFHKHMTCCEPCRESFRVVYMEWNLKNEYAQK